MDPKYFPGEYHFSSQQVAVLDYTLSLRVATAQHVIALFNVLQSTDTTSRCHSYEQ